MLFRSRHETGLKVTTWSLRLQHETEPQMKSLQENLKLQPLLLVKDLKGGRDQSFRSRPEDTLRIKNPGHDYV